MAGGSGRSLRSQQVDPRIAQTRELVLRATYELIAETGFGGATVERIAERSGVARSSIYRHWPSPLPELHMQALAPVSDRPEDVAATGDTRTDLRAYLAHVTDRLNDPVNAGVQLALIAVADRDSAYAEAHRRQLAVRTEVLRRILLFAVRGRALCECTDVDLEVRLLLAPFTYVRFIEHSKIEPGLADVVIEDLLTKADPGSPAHRCRAATGPSKRRTR